MTTAQEAQSRPRTPGTVLGVGSLAIMVLVAAVALTARPPSPPSIAEFAPQAVQSIKDAQSDQSSQFGEGDGGEGGFGTGPTTTTTTTTVPEEKRPEIIVPRVKRCVGDPPRQIEDPQAPPCIVYWDGDNGGSTYQGVTDKEILVALPNAAEGCQDLFRWFERFFNSRFQFYGRQLKFHCFGTAGGQGSGPQDAVNMKNDAQRLKKEIKPFASLGYEERGGLENIYYDELAQGGIISVSKGSFSTSAHMERYAPYQWTVPPPVDRGLRSLGDYMCSTLGYSGATAEYAGGLVTGKPRKFGVIVQRRSGATPDVQPMLDVLRNCGHTPPVVVPEDMTGDSATTMNRFSTENVTSVVCICLGSDRGAMQRAASAQQYQPEWIVFSLFGGAEELFARDTPQDQASNMLGINFWNKQLEAENLPAYWAIKEQAPGYADRPPGATYNHEIYYYKSILLLASGIQMAGPNLTPQTFQEGLFRAQFPNPGADAAPYYQAKVQFGPRDRSMNDSASMLWWDPTQPGAFGGVGGWCFVDLGLRYDIGEWPKGKQRVGQRPCR